MDWKNDDDKIAGIMRVGTFKVALLLILSIAALCIVTAHASATDVVNESFVVVEEIAANVTSVPTATPTPFVTRTPAPTGRRITQGECVVPGETIDIAGVGWFTGKLTYYGRYYDGYAGAGNSSVEAIYAVNSWDLDNFYVDPAFFSNHHGFWYAVEIYEDTGKAKGNDRIFRISDTCEVPAAENKSEVTEAVSEIDIRKGILANLTRLPVKTEPGISLIISRNTTSTFSCPAGAHYWIFGEDSKGKYYDIAEPYSGYITFDTDMVNDLNNAVYSVIFVNPGPNTIYEETYDSAKNAMTSPFRSPEDLDLVGLSPMVVRNRLVDRVGTSRDDSYVEWKVSIQDPEILIMKFSQESMGNNLSYVAMSGYTNANVGDDITILLDEDKINGITRDASTFHATVVDNGGAVAYRTWNTTFIIDFNNVFPGQHEITARSATGASATIPVYFRKEPLGHYTEPQTLNFVDNSPFVPTPTPEIIIKEVPGPVVTQIVTVTITPSEEQVHKEAEGVALVWFVIGAILLTILVAIVAFALWMRSVYRRAKI